MEEKILVNLSTDHIFESATNIIGREGEGNTSRLEITIPEILCGCSIYLDFEKPNGEKLRTPKLEVENGVAVYDVVPYLLTDEGEIKVQAVLITASGGTWKSSIKKYINQHSINALDEMPEKEDFLSEAQKILDQLSGEVAEIAEMLSNDQDFIDTIINGIEVATWVNTIDGSKLRFFVGTQAEYDALTDTENLFAIITDDTAKDEILKGIEENKTAIEENATAIEENATAIEENATAIEENATAIEENATAIATNKTGISTNKTNITKNTAVTTRITKAPAVRAVNTTGGAITKAGYYYIYVRDADGTTNFPVSYPIGIIYWEQGLVVRKRFGYGSIIYSFNMAYDGGISILQDSSNVTENFEIYVNQWGA